MCCGMPLNHSSFTPSSPVSAKCSQLRLPTLPQGQEVVRAVKLRMSEFSDILSFNILTVAVNPAYTSQVGSSCGQTVKKYLRMRWHVCRCDVNINRDFNAAVNILKAELRMARCARASTETQETRVETDVSPATDNGGGWILTSIPGSVRTHGRRALTRASRSRWEDVPIFPIVVISHG